MFFFSPVLLVDAYRVDPDCDPARRLEVPANVRKRTVAVPSNANRELGIAVPFSSGFAARGCPYSAEYDRPGLRTVIFFRSATRVPFVR